MTELMAPVVLADVFPEIAAAADYLREHGVLPPDLQLGPLPAAAQAIKDKVSRRRSVPLAALLACMRVHLRCATQLPYSRRQTPARQANAATCAAGQAK